MNSSFVPNHPLRGLTREVQVAAGLWVFCLLALLSFSTPGLAATVSPGTSWTLRNPLPTNAYLYASAWTGSQLVVVGHGGTILTSPDGIIWTSRSSGTTTSLAAVCWTGSQLVAVGDAGMVLTSLDAITWTKRSSGTTRNIKGIVWTGSQFAAVGEAGLALTSITGTTWTTRFSGTSSDLNAITVAGSSLVAVGDFGETLTSSTGVSWTEASQTPAITFNSVTWTGSQLIGVTSNGTILTSSNGAVWALQYTSGSDSFFGIGWTGSQAVAVGSGGTIVTSPDGLAWTSRTSGVTTFLLGVVQAGAQTLVVGAGGTLLTSPDVVAWTQQSMVSSKSLRDLAWTGTSIIAVGEAGSVLSSPSGTTWTVETSGTVTDLEAITWAGTQLVAVGASGTVLTSPDGVTWTAQASGTLQRLLGIVWTRSQLVAVGASGTIITSPDGIVWTAQASATVADLRGVAWTGSKLVAVGVGGAVTTSISGVGWVASTVAPFADLSEILWTGSQLVAVGDGDTVLTSTNASSWTQRSLSFSQNLLGVASNGSTLAVVGTSQTILTAPLAATPWTSVSLASPKLPQLRSVEWIGTQFIAVGDSGTIMTSGTPTPPTPVVSFNLVSSSVPESVGTVTLGVNLSIAPVTAVTIPFTVTGTAVPTIPALAASSGTTGDYTATLSPLTFAAGQSAKTIVVTVIDDVKVESTEALIVAIGNPTKAIIGGNNSFTLSILDNDIAPVVTLDPVSQIVAVGSPVTSFTTAATGSSPLTFQWLKNSKNIPSATGSTFSLFMAQLSHAGRYSALSRNPTSTDLSAVAELGVVDTAPRTFQVPIGLTATMSIATAGNGLTYQWKKNNVSMVNGARITGVTTAKLMIANVDTPDTDVYTCEVTGPGGIITGGANNFTALLPPVMNPPSLPSNRVSGAYSYALSATNFATQFNVSGLPAGLTCSPSTGVISGRSLVAGTFVVSMSASNAAGTSPTISTPLIVQSLPFGSIGSFAGIIDRESTVNNDLGGRFVLNTTGTGSYTGTLVLGKQSYAFKGQLDAAYNASAQGTLTIPGTSIQLAFTIDELTNSVAGTVSNGGPPADLTGWRNVWHITANPASNRVGYYSFGLDLLPGDVGDIDIPQGSGFGSFTTSADGSLIVTGRLSDGSIFSSSTFMGPDGDFGVYQLCFGGAGSLLGSLVVTPDLNSTFTGNEVDGTLTWARITAAPLTTRAYATPFGPTDLSAFGKYLASAKGQIILGLPSPATSPTLDFAEGDIGSATIDPSASFTFTSLNSIVMPTAGGPFNPGRTTLKIDAKSGAIEGGFTLVDSGVTRKVTFNGQIVRPLSGPRKAVGYFLLPQLPLLNNTSPVLSGQMLIQQ